MYEILFFLIWFFAAFITGISGLGAAMAAVPFISLFINPHDSIAISSCLVSVLCLEIGLLYRKYLLLRQMKQMLIGSIPGLILGIFILWVIPANILLIGIGTIMIFFVVWQFLHQKKETFGKETNFKAQLAGFLSGLLSTSVSFGGPPCAVYALHVGWKQKETISTINLFVSVSLIIGAVMYYFSGFITPEVLRWTVIGIPAVTAGIFASVPVIKYINIRLFRLMLLLIIACGGIACILRSV